MKKMNYYRIAIFACCFLLLVWSIIYALKNMLLLIPIIALLAFISAAIHRHLLK